MTTELVALDRKDTGLGNSISELLRLQTVLTTVETTPGAASISPNEVMVLEVNAALQGSRMTVHIISRPPRFL